MWGLIGVGVIVCVIAWVTGTMLLGIPGCLLILWGVVEVATDERASRS